MARRGDTRTLNREVWTVSREERRWNEESTSERGERDRRRDGGRGGAKNEERRKVGQRCIHVWTHLFKCYHHDNKPHPSPVSSRLAHTIMSVAAVRIQMTLNALSFEAALAPLPSSLTPPSSSPSHTLTSWR